MFDFEKGKIRFIRGGKYPQSIDVIYQREEMLLAFLDSGPKTLQEITAHGIIYGGHKLANGAWDLSLSEKSMMHKHLERLERIGSVKKENGTYNLL